MLIQVYIKNEPVEKCDLLIAKEDAVLSIPVSNLKELQDAELSVAIVKASENMAMKAAVYAAGAIAGAKSVSSPVFVACPDKAILDGMCSMEYDGPAGGPIKCVPSGTKPQPAPRVRNRTRPKAAEQPAGQDDGQDGKEAATSPDGATPANTPETAASRPGNGAEPAEEDSMQGILSDPALVKDGEVNTDGAGEPEAPGKPDPTIGNTKSIMAILKEQGVPSGQIPGVLEALREAMDASITLPMQVKLKLAKDGATGDMDPEKTAKLVAPRFDELKSLLKEIDEHNSRKQ